MKKIVFSIIGLISFVNAIYAQKTLYLQTLIEAKGVERTIPTRTIEETKDGLKVTYYFNYIHLLDDPLYTCANIVKIEGFWPNTNVGEPATLSRWDTFVVPEGGAKVIVNDSSFVEIPLELSPARPILPNSGNESYTKDNVIPIAGFRGHFPSNFIPTTRNDSYRGLQLLDVCLTPVQYDFTNKKVRVLKMIQYSIQYDVSALKESLSKHLKERLSGNTFLDNIALNIPHKISLQNLKTASQLTGSISSKYLIISVPKYTTAVNRFAEWKKTLGFDVQIEIRTSWDTTMVKNVVREAYETDSIQYLLIVGGHSDVPAIIRNKKFNHLNHYHPTDLYYGCISSGYTPDIFRGRILVNTANEAMTVVEKIINYEKCPIQDEYFYKTGAHCAYFQDVRHTDSQWNIIPVDGYEDRRFVLTSERIRNGLLNIIDSISRIYYAKDTINPTHWNHGTYANGEAIPVELRRPMFAWDGDSTDITNCINQKAFYVFMRDHGSITSWEYPSYTINNISSLSNGDYLPVVFSICCYTGKFNGSECFCESFLKKENGGCVAIYGATHASLSGPNDVMAEGVFDAIWPSLNLRPQFGIVNGTIYTPTPSPTYRLGQILDQGLKRTDEAYLNTSCDWYPQYTSELFHCFGDPSMMIYTEKPRAFVNATINRQENGMIYVDTGGILSTISFYNRSTGEVSSYSGYEASYQGGSETSVCISAHNMIPYLDEGTLYIQNQTLTNGGYYEAKSIKVGNHVTTTQTQGDVNFSHGDYHLVGKAIELHPGTSISVGTTMEIKNK